MIEIRETRRKDLPYKSLKRDLCRRGASREEFGELGIPTTFQVVGPRSRICTNPAKDVLLRIRKRNLSFEEGGRGHGDILYINSKSTTRKNQPLPRLNAFSSVREKNKRRIEIDTTTYKLYIHILTSKMNI